MSGTINGMHVPLLLDTGAAVTLLRKDTWLQTAAGKSQNLKPWITAELVSAGGTPLTVHGCASVDLELGHHKFERNVVVVSPLTSEAILGLDFLTEQQASIDLGGRRLFLKESGCSVPLEDPALHTENATEVSVHATMTTEVPPRSILQVAGSIENPVEGTWVVEEATEKKLPFAVARVLVEPTSTDVPLCILNHTDEPMTVYSGMRLATLQGVEFRSLRVDAVSSAEPTGSVGTEKQEMLWNIVEQSGAHLSPGEKDHFFQLLLEYGDVLAFSTSDLGRTSKLRHHINTGQAPPIRQPVRRVPPHRRGEVRELLDQMLDKGVIEPSASPWASPIVLVQKKDGSTRFCVDYRKVNDVTRKDAYPLPRIDATLDTLHGSQWFSTMDLVSGYWQVEVDQADREKTAFCTTEGLFQFRVMPFGLCNAPATFQRLMDLVLAGLQWRECLVYLDDVIILGRDFEEHLNNIRSVLQRLRDAGLRLKPSKCSFFQQQVKYLGHIISQDGISTDPDKTNRVREWPPPSSKREVQQFLGLASYYRRFVKNFAHIAQPLHRLTQRTASFTWTHPCQEAFNELRKRLCSAPILAYPDFSRQFILDTDASDVGIGAVLSQVDDEGQERVVAYGSRTLSKAERRYCVTRRELLAVVVFTQQYRPYLSGRKFLLRTDHGSLTWLKNFKEPEGQLARWLERLQELDFHIVHRRGRAHTNADALSRLPCRQCGRDSHMTPPPAEHEVVAANILQPLQDATYENLRGAQLADPILGPLLRGKEVGEKPGMDSLGVASRASRRLLQLWDQLTVKEGVLCRRFESPDGSSAALQIVVPSTLRKEVLADLHEGAMGGHLGCDKTLSRLKQRFYWPGHYNDVRDWCANCGICVSRKDPSPKARAPLKNILTGYPLQIVAMDIVGPFPESAAGNTYVLVVGDYFTRWMEAYPIPNQEATTVAKKLVNEFFFRFSPPEQLHSDQGRNFESEIIAEICKLLGVVKSRTTPYHPQSDGLIERFNRTLLDMLAKAVKERPFGWEDHLQRLCLAYNTSVNQTTGYSPFYLMFGRQVRMPIDLMYGCPDTHTVTVPQYVADLRASLRKAYENVMECMESKLDRQKEYYDQKVHGEPYNKGDLVWLHNPAVRRGRSSLVLGQDRIGLSAGCQMLCIVFNMPKCAERG